MDPEALFLASSADYIRRQFESALEALQKSLLASAGTAPKEMAARYYYQACICFKLLNGTEQAGPNGVVKPPPLSEKRRGELNALAAHGITEALRLDPRLHSAYIDAEMIGKYFFPDDPHAAVKMHRRVPLAAHAAGGLSWHLPP